MALQGINVSDLARVRKDFLEAGVLPADLLAPHIQRSWHRCQDHMGSLPPPEPLRRDLLSERRDAAEWLLRCAQPELDALAEHVVGQGCVVILSDAAGLILEEVGCPEFLPKARRIALQPGVDWSELQRGTNAIGTALIERQPVMVLGPEHLLAENSAIGCTAAPIITERGDLAGVLDISGEPGRVDGHALGLVRMAAAQIEHRMLVHRHQGGHEEELVHFHWRAGFLGTPREGLLSVVDGRITGFNRIAADLLPGGWPNWLDVPVEQLFGDRWRALRAAPGLWNGPGARAWAVAVDPPRARRRPPTPVVDRVDAPLDASAAAAGAVPIDRAADPLATALERARRVFDAGLPVLIAGETGSGKDVFARRLHEASSRCGKPMVAVNCAAIPETLIEAELFGYEEGAFTGARRGGSPGRIRETQGGVLFLDEIGDMPLAMQARLLRVLESRRVRPLGGSRDIEVDFALVCASHRDLKSLAAEGLFREDLLYRLRGYEVQLPPLRARPDRRQLMESLFAQLGGQAQRISLAPAALDRLAAHTWPGNFRELNATLRAALALAESGAAVQADDLPPLALAAGRPARRAPNTAAADLPHESTGGAGVAAAGGGGLAELTDVAIHQALDAARGNVAAAARALGIHRSTVYRYLDRQR